MEPLREDLESCVTVVLATRIDFIGILLPPSLLLFGADVERPRTEASRPIWAGFTSFGDSNEATDCYDQKCQYNQCGRQTFRIETVEHC